MGLAGNRRVPLTALPWQGPGQAWHGLQRHEESGCSWQSQAGRPPWGRAAQRLPPWGMRQPQETPGNAWPGLGTVAA